MAIRYKDEFLWLGLGVGVACLGALAVHKQLARARELAEAIAKSEVSQDETGAEINPAQISWRTENAIKIETLGHLAQSSNIDVRAASIRIIRERSFGSAKVWQHLQRDIASRDRKRRERALLLIVEHLKPIAMFEYRVQLTSVKTYTAVIRCLLNMLPDARNVVQRGCHHTSAAADALWLLHKLVEHDVMIALNAGLVSKWLRAYPFKGLQNGEDKAMIVRNMLICFEYADDYERLFLCVLHEMQRHVEARTEMSDHGLWHPSFGIVSGGESPEFQWDNRRHCFPASIRLTSDSHMSIDETSYVGPVDQPNGTMMRGHEESIEERALRRRRREAMVLGEEGRPLSGEDIIEGRAVTVDSN